MSCWEKYCYGKSDFSRKGGSDSVWTKLESFSPLQESTATSHVYSRHDKRHYRKIVHKCIGMAENSESETISWSYTFIWWHAGKCPTYLFFKITSVQSHLPLFIFLKISDIIENLSTFTFYFNFEVNFCKNSGNVVMVPGF